MISRYLLVSAYFISIIKGGNEIWVLIQNLAQKRKRCRLSEDYKTTSYIRKEYSKSIEMLESLKDNYTTT